MKETLAQIPQNITEEQADLSINNLLNASQEDWIDNWQEPRFTKIFPQIVHRLLSRGSTEEDKATIYTASLTSFMDVYSSNIKLAIGYRFNKDGGITAPISMFENTDPLVRTEIACILLIGMSLPNKEGMRQVLDLYQVLPKKEKKKFSDQLSYLLEKNNVSKAWLKERKLDSNNGFDWDTELATLLFFGIYKNPDSYFVPHEMKQEELLVHYSLETVGVILDYALQRGEKLIKLRTNTELPKFVIAVEEFLNNFPDDSTHHQEIKEGMRKKLGSFKEIIGFIEPKSPASSISSQDLLPAGEISYARTGNRPS